METGTDPKIEHGRAAEPAWMAATPALFVLVWSTGFLGARMGSPHAEPFTFLFLRFAVAAALFAAICLLWHAPWPKSWPEVRQALVAGALVHGLHLGGVFWAIHSGVATGTVAIIVGIQPLLTSTLAGPYLGERISPRQWLGLGTGLAGIALVVGDSITISADQGPGMAAAVLALLGLSLGTLYQKRHGAAMNLRTGSTIQLAAAALLMLPLALMLETGEINWTGEFVFALIWLVLVLSLGAFTLLYFLIRRGAAARTASLFYLIPPVVAVEAWFLFGETITVTTLIGMGLAALAVALVTRD